MIYVALPVGSNFGWGILGKEVALELSRLTEICLLAPPNFHQPVSDEFDLFQIRRLMPGPDVIWRLAGSIWLLDGPVIQMAYSSEFITFVPQITQPAHVGFAVFEENILPSANVQRARQVFRHLATGSTYCTEVLRQHGLTNVSTVLHGVDCTLFQPREQPRSFLKDKFLIFSGGKFELRKGQDIVIRAYKVLQDRHRDVMLVNSWYSQWASALQTMAGSKLIRYHPLTDKDYIGWMNGLLAANGIDVDRVITVGMRDNRLLPGLYHATDVGLFPNRVEGGTNMVLMEYMACGKPVVASYNSGHKDVLRQENAVLIEKHAPMDLCKNGAVTCTCGDPDLEETIEKLEWCYQNRDRLKVLGQQAAADMQTFTWKRVAEGLLAAVRLAEA